MKVSFDFDDTLCNSTHGQPLWEVVNHMKEHHEKGDEIFIVTTRMHYHMPEVDMFVQKHDLPVKKENRHCTNMEYKFKTLKELGIHKHFDDNPEEFDRMDDTIEKVFVPADGIPKSWESFDKTRSYRRTGWNSWLD
jgi:hypothetical protein